MHAAVTDPVIVRMGEIHRIPTGISLEIPSGFEVPGPRALRPRARSAGSRSSTRPGRSTRTTAARSGHRHVPQLDPLRDPARHAHRAARLRADRARRVRTRGRALRDGSRRRAASVTRAPGPAEPMSRVGRNRGAARMTPRQGRAPPLLLDDHRRRDLPGGQLRLPTFPSDAAEPGGRFSNLGGALGRLVSRRASSKPFGSARSACRSSWCSPRGASARGRS